MTQLLANHLLPYAEEDEETDEYYEDPSSPIKKKKKKNKKDDVHGKRKRYKPTRQKSSGHTANWLIS